MYFRTSSQCGMQGQMALFERAQAYPWFHELHGLGPSQRGRNVCV